MNPLGCQEGRCKETKARLRCRHENKADAMSMCRHEATPMRVPCPFGIQEGGRLEKESSGRKCLSRPTKATVGSRQRHPPTKMNAVGIVAQNKKQPSRAEVESEGRTTSNRQGHAPLPIHHRPIPSSRSQCVFGLRPMQRARRHRVIPGGAT